MNYVDHSNFAPCEGSSRGRTVLASQRSATERVGILHRVFDSLARAQQRQAERAIAQEFSRLGGRLTDDIERRMMDWITHRRMF